MLRPSKSATNFRSYFGCRFGTPSHERALEAGAVLLKFQQFDIFGFTSPSLLFSSDQKCCCTDLFSFPVLLLVNVRHVTAQ